MDTLKTIRFSLLQMRKRWVLTSAAALSLALCLGLNSAIFSVFNAVLLRPMPFPEPERLVEIYNTYPDGGVPKASSNIQLYTVYKSEMDTMEGFTLLSGAAVTFGADEGAQRITALRASTDFFGTMGIVPELGQPFQPEQGIEGSHEVVLLTHGFWQSAFAADPGVIGKKIDLDGRPHQIIGVLPESFRQYNSDIQVMLPFAWNPAEINMAHRHLNYATLVARLKKDCRIEQAQAQVDTINGRYIEENPDMRGFLERTGHRTLVRPYQEERVASVKPTLYLLNVFALSILVIGALNIANLRLADVVGRERELTIRRVMGGSRRQILSQLMIEAAVLGFIGAILGLVTAYLSVDILRDSFSGMVRDADSIQLDGSVLAWSLILTVLTILIVGLSPFRILWRLNYQTLLQEGGRTSAGGGKTRLRTGMSIVQTALAVLLLIATGLFVRSFWNATAIDPGFRASELHTFRLSLPEARYPDEASRVSAVRRILAEVGALPGVENVTGATSVPIVTGMPYYTFSVYGEADEDQQVQKAADNFFITENFFATLGIPVLEGRPLEETDDENMPGAYVVEQALQEKFLMDPVLGNRMIFGAPPEAAEDWPSIVGVVPDIIHRELTVTDQAPLVYRSYYQAPQPRISFIIRSTRDHESLMGDVRKVVANLDGNLPLFLTGRLSEMIENSLQNRKAVLLLTILFAILALLLAQAGIYGVQSYNVQSDIRSIAIRAAIGASPASLMKRTLFRSLVPVVLGLLLGVGAAEFLAPKAADHVFGVGVRDPLTITVVVLLILSISVFALLWPARMAARCNPARILHED